MNTLSIAGGIGKRRKPAWEIKTSAELLNYRTDSILDPNGLLYMRARYYSPNLRRFLNSDPIGFGGGLNFFAYANGNPILQSDPSGYAPQLKSITFSLNGGFVSAGYSPDIDWGQWDPNWGGKGFLPPAPEYEAAIVAVPAVVFGGTAAIVTAPQWVPSALMLGGSVGSIVNTRIAQFLANNSWALPTLNKAGGVFYNYAQNVTRPGLGYALKETGKAFVDLYNQYTSNGTGEGPNMSNGPEGRPREGSADSALGSQIGNLGAENDWKSSDSLDASVNVSVVGGAGNGKKP